MTKPTLSVIATTFAVALLAGCGGGGNSSSPDLNPNPTPTPSAEDSSMVTAIETPTYATGSEESAAFNLLNRERVRCGFGSLKQNAQLDQAARWHADWMLQNSTYAHYQFSPSTNFTGITPADRASAAGYVTTFGVDEGAAFGVTGSKLGRGEKGVRELLAGVYHAISALRPMKDIGISVREPADVGRTSVIVPTEIVYSTQTGYQQLASDNVVTYPCEGSTGTEYGLFDEEPNPVPGRNLSTQPLGQPIIVMVRVGQTLVINSASMVRVSDGQSVQLRSPVTGSSDPNGQLANTPYIGYVLPDAALDPNTQYRVSVTGTNNGANFEKVFTFSTGS